MTESQLSRQEIIRSIRYERNHHRITGILMLLLPVQLISLALTGHSFNLTVGSVVVMYVVYVLIMQRAWFRRFGNRGMHLDENWVLDRILTVSLPEHFQNVRFEDQEKIPEQVMQVPGFSFTKGCDTYRAKKYATAMSGITQLEIQHMAIGRIQTHWDLPDGNQTSTSYQYLDPRFEGMMYLCHLNKPFTPTGLHTGKPVKGEIKTGDAAFDRVFSVRTRDPGTMPLTPELRHFLAESAGKIKGRVYLHFASTGDVYVGFNRHIYKRQPKRPEEPFEQLDLQAQMVTGLIRGLTLGF